MMKKHVVMALILTLANFAYAGDCRQTASVCVDTTPEKNIGGTIVKLADVGGCWNFQDTYECVKPNSVDYCAAIRNTPGCYQTSAQVKSYAFNGAVIDQTFTYRCNDVNLATPPNTVRLDGTYTIVKDEFNHTQCAAQESNIHCQLASHTCTQGPATRIINGLPVYKDCWEYKDEYSCLMPTKNDDCQDLRNKGCTQVDSTCLTQDPNGFGCTMKQISYSCLIRKGETKTEEDCSVRQVCQNGTCWDTSSPNDTDFAQVVAMQEALREAGKYDPDASNLFRGISQGCTKGYIGLKNCCKTDTAAGQDNNSVMSQMLVDAGKSGAGEIANVGSKYAYDFLYSDTGWLGSGSSCVSTLFEPTNFTASFGAYGFSVGAAGATAPTFLGTSATALGGPVMGMQMYFNPYALAFAVAMQIIMEMIECTPEEQKLGMARGSNLCTYVGSYCSTKVLGGCVETKQNYCCFNSKLSRIINEQGRPQLGRSWGTAKDPDCRGFTADEFSHMDWSKIDMGEFVTDIMSSVVVPDAGAISKQMTDNMTTRLNNNPIVNNPTSTIKK